MASFSHFIIHHQVFGSKHLHISNKRFFHQKKIINVAVVNVAYRLVLWLFQENYRQRPAGWRRILTNQRNFSWPGNDNAALTNEWLITDLLNKRFININKTLVGNLGTFLGFSALCNRGKCQRQCLNIIDLMWLAKGEHCRLRIIRSAVGFEVAELQLQLSLSFQRSFMASIHAPEISTSVSMLFKRLLHLLLLESVTHTGIATLPHCASDCWHGDASRSVFQLFQFSAHCGRGYLLDQLDQ